MSKFKELKTGRCSLGSQVGTISWYLEKAWDLLSDPQESHMVPATGHIIMIGINSIAQPMEFSAQGFWLHNCPPLTSLTTAAVLRGTNGPKQLPTYTSKNVYSLLFMPLDFFPLLLLCPSWSTIYLFFIHFPTLIFGLIFMKLSSLCQLMPVLLLWYTYNILPFIACFFYLQSCCAL